MTEWGPVQCVFHGECWEGFQHSCDHLWMKDLQLVLENGCFFLWSYLQVSLNTSGMRGTNFHSHARQCKCRLISVYISIEEQKRRTRSVSLPVLLTQEWRRAKHTPLNQDYSHVSDRAGNVNITVGNHHRVLAKQWKGWLTRSQLIYWGGTLSHTLTLWWFHN